MTVPSPFASGGGGDTFEKLAGARVLATLLAREIFAGLDLPLTKVGFQQRHAERLLDDIVVHGEQRGVARSVEFQVRHQPRLIASDPDFVTLFANMLRVLRGNADAVRLDTVRLGLIVAAFAPGVRSLRDLTERARAHISAEGFYAAIATPGHASDELRVRLRHLLRAKELADGTAVVEDDPEVWRLLCCLQVLMWDLEGSAASETTTAINQLRRALAPGGEEHRAQDLFDSLRAIVADLAPLGGELNHQRLQERLQDRFSFGPAVTVSSRGVATTPFGIDALLQRLGLADSVKRAESLRTSSPSEAADILGKVAQSLSDQQLSALARAFRDRQVEALIAAGRHAEAADLLYEMALDDLERGT